MPLFLTASSLQWFVHMEFWKFLHIVAIPKLHGADESKQFGGSSDTVQKFDMKLWIIQNLTWHVLSVGIYPAIMKTGPNHTHCWKVPYFLE